jgi:hypothetical protein
MKKLSKEEMKKVMAGTGGGGGGGDIITCWVFTDCLNCPPGQGCVDNPNRLPTGPDGMCAIVPDCPAT